MSQFPFSANLERVNMTTQTRIMLAIVIVFLALVSRCQSFSERTLDTVTVKDDALGKKRVFLTDSGRANLLQRQEVLWASMLGEQETKWATLWQAQDTKWTALFQEQNTKLIELTSLVHQQKRELSDQKVSLLEHQEKLRQQQQKLSHQERFLNEQDRKIVSQEKVLRQQSQKLSHQQSLLQEQAAKLSYFQSRLQKEEKANSGLKSKHIPSQPLHRVESLVTKITPQKSPLQHTILDSGSHSVVPRSDDAGPLEAVVSHISQQVTEMGADIQTLKNSNTQQDLAIQDAQSSTFVHWGSSTCTNLSDTVYSGVVGGSWYEHTGAATNYLCLTMSPVLSNHPMPSDMAFLYGGEYQTEISHHDKDPMCAVCRSTLSTTVMIPGTNVCTPGWHLQYSGFLMAGRYNHAAGSEYICVDSKLENTVHGDANQNGKLLYYTVTRCGSLPCSPYVNNKVVTCAVCSK